MTSGTARRDWLMALLGEHETSLGRYAARIVGDADRAKDVVQETFLRLWKCGEGEVGDNPAAWLYTVCRNLCFDHLRKERRMVPLAQDDVPAFAETDDGRRDGLSEVLKALDHLPAKQQEVIRLKFQSGLSYKDISRITGHSVTNVGFLIHTGVKALRQAMGEGAPKAARRPSTKGGAQ